MVKDVYYGNTLRKSFARHDEIIDMPDLLEIQKKSYQWFLDVGPVSYTHLTLPTKA